ncbi:MAG: HAMP domain-containing histidine kinase [Clostridiales bacterium]|nr:HAMP domain-containing histidine kinase [Clostridiales bacterium]
MSMGKSRGKNPNGDQTKDMKLASPITKVAALVSPITKVAALAIGYFAAIASVSALSYSFRFRAHHLEGALGDWTRVGLIGIPIFGICAAVFFISIWRSKGSESPRFWRNVDWAALAVLSNCLIFLSVHVVRDTEIFITPDVLAALTFGTYVLAMLTLGRILACVRDGDILRTCYLYRFFRLYPVWRPMGAVAAALLAWCLWCLFLMPNAWPALYFATWPALYFAWLPWYFFAVFVFVALVCFCAFVLSLSAEYEKANAEKVRAERFKGELITNVSHDIRTPLSAVISYVGLLKNLPKLKGEYADYVAVLDKKTARLKTLIDDLMEASKAGTGNISVSISEVDLGELVGQVAGDFEDQFCDRELTLVIRQPDEAVFAQADSRHLWRALENLFGNAAKYALPGTRVFAGIALCDGRPLLSLKNVSEHPIDIQAEELAEQFIRGDRSRHTDGSGLGLYIAKSLVEAMGGGFSIRASGDLFEAEIALPHRAAD